MELKYIIAIIVGGMFILLLAASLAFIYVYRLKERARNSEISKMYADPKLAKMDYDLAAYDEETTRILSGNGAEGQLSIDDIIDIGDDIEGLEEITGNYNPDLFM